MGTLLGAGVGLVVAFWNASTDSDWYLYIALPERQLPVAVGCAIAGAFLGAIVEFVVLRVWRRRP